MKMRQLKFKLGKKVNLCKKVKRDWLLLEELVDDRVYGVYCHGRKRFGTGVHPAMGEAIKASGDRVFDYDAVRLYHNSKLPRYTFNEANLRRKFVKVRAPNGDFFAVELYQGHYEPPRKVIRFKVKKFSAK
jgi:hypothetical protein